MLKKPETLFVLGYMLLPLLALLSAIVGLTMILGGNKIAGAIVLVVVTQVFAFGAFFALVPASRLLKIRPARGVWPTLDAHGRRDSRGHCGSPSSSQREQPAVMQLT